MAASAFLYNSPKAPVLSSKSATPILQLISTEMPQQEKWVASASSLAFLSVRETEEIFFDQGEGGVVVIEPGHLVPLGQQIVIDRIRHHMEFKIDPGRDTVYVSYKFIIDDMGVIGN